jgi:hypothetical protein
MCNLGYTPCLANNDVWFRANVRATDGFEYYEYVLIYVDDILCVSHDARSVEMNRQVFPNEERRD